MPLSFLLLLLQCSAVGLPLGPLVVGVALELGHVILLSAAVLLEPLVLAHQRAHLRLQLLGLAEAWLQLGALSAQVEHLLPGTLQLLKGTKSKMQFWNLSQSEATPSNQNTLVSISSMKHTSFDFLQSPWN